MEMWYQYNIIFDRAIHHAYLFMKIPGPEGVISVWGDQNNARRAEYQEAAGRKKVHAVEDECSSHREEKATVDVFPI